MMELDGYGPMLAQAALSLVFLGIGWLLGRESAGRSVFGRPPLSRRADAAPGESDPWAEAALDVPRPGREVDSFFPKGLEMPAASGGDFLYHADFM